MTLGNVTNTEDYYQLTAQEAALAPPMFQIGSYERSGVDLAQIGAPFLGSIGPRLTGDVQQPYSDVM